MCGISAVLDYRADGMPLRRALARMHEALAHRGPDGEGALFLDARLDPIRHAEVQPDGADGSRAGFAFRELRIQDPTGDAAQPFTRDERQWILLNGEIYNFPSLRRELETLGHCFETRSDTEVALAAWREWGTGCFARFNGMWAILIVDLERGRLVGCRDRLGIKPLFYSLEAGRLLFASEAAAVARARSEGARLEPHRYREFLAGFPPDSPALSFFKDVHPVPAGTWFEVPLAADAASPPVFHPFWRLDEIRCEPGSVRPFEECREELVALLRDSVRSQLTASVSIGCLLSGGLDTSMVARLITETRGGGTVTPAFSIVYSDPEMSEWPYIQAVVAQGGLRGHSHLLTTDEAWNSVDAVVRAQGQPLLGQEVIAQYHAYRLARENGVIVVLEGQGADEMLAGMPGYEQPIFPELLMTLRWAALSREIHARARRYRRSRWSLVRQHFLAPAVVQARARARRLLGSSSYEWLDTDALGGASVNDEPPAPSDKSHDRSMLNRRLYQLVRHTNLPTALLYQDRSSMAHGVEGRVPFLDHRIVEFAFRLPAEYKVRDGLRKRVLLDAARAFLPDLVLNRTDKKTFVSKLHWMPLRERYAGPLREMAASRTIRETPGFDPPAVRRFVEDYLSGRNDDILAVWRLFTACRWLELHGLT